MHSSSIMSFARVRDVGAHRAALKAQASFRLGNSRVACGLGCALHTSGVRLQAAFSPYGIPQHTLDRVVRETNDIMSRRLVCMSAIVSVGWMFFVVGAAFIAVGAVWISASTTDGNLNMQAIGMFIAAGTCLLIWRSWKCMCESDYRNAKRGARSAAAFHINNAVAARWRESFASAPYPVFVSASERPCIPDANAQDSDTDSSIPWRVPNPANAPQVLRGQWFLHITVGAPHQWPLYYDDKSEIVYADEVAEVNAASAVAVADIAAIPAIVAQAVQPVAIGVPVPQQQQQPLEVAVNPLRRAMTGAAAGATCSIGGEAAAGPARCAL